MTVFHISDLHFNHSAVLEFSKGYRDGDDILEHNHILIQKWNSVVTKRDKVFVYGDVFFNNVEEGLKLVSELRGLKYLFLGNHDRPAHIYAKHFHQVNGLGKFDGFWQSHSPLHPQELRGLKNLHGHSHNDIVRNGYGEPDLRYINVCVERCDGIPIPHEEIKNGRFQRRSLGLREGEYSAGVFS